jgi:hypothetical protein
MNPLIQTTLRFINRTSTHIFLTGKAGTGKTTFLKNLSPLTYKTFIIVAPTGIAALNAGGVTIHSQFLFPPGMFIPDRDEIGELPSGGYNSHTLARKHPLNSVRKHLLRAIDLLVIDEASMLRADLLDAIDYRLRSARGNYNQPFGGVQLLLIGDLYQLPPVVKNEEASLMKRYYNSPWFFESKALKQAGFTYIELDKIFRQQDEDFIRLLNNLRDNTPTAEDIHTLNRYYRSEEEIQQLEEVITLTTHNYRADELNQRALRLLNAPLHVFKATLTGEFPPHACPAPMDLALKVGAQIMFIKNDSENKLYYNGKLATVHRISNGEITVKLADDHTTITLRKEVWQNKRYTLSDETQAIEDEILGTFEQYPVKLAWAITVHKSQGLTFDRAIIDVGNAFADGQVYVALSRLRSLEGLILRTRIDPGVISTDREVVTFSSGNNNPEELPKQIAAKQQEYIRLCIDRTFSFESLSRHIHYLIRDYVSPESGMRDRAEPLLTSLQNALHAEALNTEKFRKQLHGLLDRNDHSLFMERIEKGSNYYHTFLLDQQKTLLTHLEEMKQHKRVKNYTNSLADLDQGYSKMLEEVDRARIIIQSILEENDVYSFAEVNERRETERKQLLETVRASLPEPPPGRKKKKKKAEGDKSTYDITLDLLKAGLTPEQIAIERSLVLGTIESHLARAIAQGVLDCSVLLTQEQMKEISEAMEGMPSGFSSKDLFHRLHGKYTYERLRVAMSVHGKTTEKGNFTSA